MLKVHIRKRLHTFDLDINFEAGNEVLGILGPSGSGKSMTLKCIAGIETPDWGHIELDGRTLFDSRAKINLPPQQRKVGYLFQQYALFPAMTVEQNLFAGIPKEEKKNSQNIIEDAIDRMNLKGVEKKKPYQLSGGQKQRVALGRILLNHPQILLLDEPLSALDLFLKWQVELELKSLFESWPGTILLVTHNLGELSHLCDQVSVLHEGVNQTKQTVRELYSHPATVVAAKLAGCRNFSRIKLVDWQQKRFKALDWGIELLSSNLRPKSQFCGIFNHDIMPLLTDAPSVPEDKIENTFVVKKQHILWAVAANQVVCKSKTQTNDSPLFLECPTEYNELNLMDEFSVCLPSEKILCFDS